MDEITWSKVSICAQGKLQSNLFIKSITDRGSNRLYSSKQQQNDKIENWLVECTCRVVNGGEEGKKRWDEGK